MFRILFLLFSSYVYRISVTNGEIYLSDDTNPPIDSYVIPTKGEHEVPDATGQSIYSAMNSTAVQHAEDIENAEIAEDEVSTDTESLSGVNSAGVQVSPRTGQKRMRTLNYMPAPPNKQRRVTFGSSFSRPGGSGLNRISDRDSSSFLSNLNNFLGTLSETLNTVDSNLQEWQISHGASSFNGWPSSGGFSSSNSFPPSSSFPSMGTSGSGMSTVPMLGSGGMSQSVSSFGPGSGRCGQPYFQPTVMALGSRMRSQQRIVGGSAANPHSFPWMASLQQGTAHYCGGALIRVSPKVEQSDIVITASHCLAMRPRNLRVVLGAHSLTDSNAVAIKAANYHHHELYNDRKTINDIGIIKLERPVTFNENIQPLCLPEQDEPVPLSEYGVVAGWGTLREGRIDLPGHLMQVAVPMVSDAMCVRDYRTEVDMRYMFCAGYDRGGKDSCQGDSGGPLFFKTANGWTLRGVVSFGEGCARARKPGVYTRVSRYRKWINDKIRSLTSLPV